MEKINEKIRKKEEQIMKIEERLNKYKEQLNEYQQQKESKKIEALLATIKKKGLKIEEAERILGNKDTNSHENTDKDVTSNNIYHEKNKQNNKY